MGQRANACLSQPQGNRNVPLLRVVEVMRPRGVVKNPPAPMPVQLDGDAADVVQKAEITVAENGLFGALNVNLQQIDEGQVKPLHEAADGAGAGAQRSVAQVGGNA